MCSLRQHMQYKHTEGIIIHSAGCPSHLRSNSYSPCLVHGPHKATSTSKYLKNILKMAGRLKSLSCGEKYENFSQAEMRKGYDRLRARVCVCVPEGQEAGLGQMVHKGVTTQ